MSSLNDSIAVIIPAFNAEATLPSLINALRAFVEAPNIVVVNDGSTDSTALLANQAGVLLLEHRVNRGKGAALRTGLEFVRRLPQFRHVLTIDADLQHRVEDIPRFMEVQRATGANVVVGTRTRIGTGMPFPRILSNTITSKLVSARTGVRIPDSQCGFRMLDRIVIEAVKIESDGYESETEFLIKAALKGFHIESVPITTVYGNERSHMSHWATTLRFIRVLFKDYS
ncbi:MAG: glycosyltransferase family 2 protein [Bacteroidota bacterium]